MTQRKSIQNNAIIQVGIGYTEFGSCGVDHHISKLDETEQIMIL